MAGRTRMTLKRVTALAERGEALWNAVYAALPINVRDYTRIESEVELAWMKAEESVGQARSALDRLADLVKAKVERADGVRQLVGPEPGPNDLPSKITDGEGTSER